MFDRDRIRDELKSQARDELFKSEFFEAYNRQLSLKKDKLNKTYAETVDRTEYGLKPLVQAPQAFTIEGDDELQSKKWESALKDAAFYFENPRLDQEKQIMGKFKLRYDDLFEDGWKADFRNRHALLMWTCKQQQTYFANKGGEAGECHYGELLEKYGPNYAPLRAKLAHVKGLFD